MSITIITTPGDALANSYVTLAEANEYLESHIQSGKWQELDDERKKGSLISATRQIDVMRFVGRRCNYEQSLAWPRLGVLDNDWFEISGIPLKLKAAVCELAIWNLTDEDRLAGKFEIENMETVEIGPIKYKVRNGARTLPMVVDALITSIGPDILSSSSTSQQMTL